MSPQAEIKANVDEIKETQIRSSSRASKKERKTRSRHRARRASKNPQTIGNIAFLQLL